ncbi:class I SAM-dependent methyltransferase [Nocardia sp. BMG51109]|uniref:class I SAM-dependent methyltransferase n=1 Tax=Nocardia sp. BMG51109 TaxID=1056816 RepID=UPI0004AD071E|nr:class I SAM-dependent methyltransferase [Nocardia sp. BMG51109]
MIDTSAHRLLRIAETIADGSVRLRLRLWDGSAAGEDGPVVVFRNRNALRWMLFRPGDLGVARAYVSGDLDIEGGLVDVVREFMGATGHAFDDLLAPRVRPTLARLAALAAIADLLRHSGGVGLPPRPPATEVARAGLRGAAAVRHHYDLDDEFYRLMLGPSMVYSGAVWKSPAQSTDLEAAQLAKLDRVCERLELQPGMRLLDIGCGWGALAVHAAQHYGVDVVGVTLARNQARYARELAGRCGVSDRVDIRLCDYRDITDGPFDAVSSIEMTFHLDARARRAHARTAYDLLRPGGRLFCHEITASRRGRLFQRFSGFITAYIFPEIDIPTRTSAIDCLESAGFDVHTVEDLRDHFTASHRAWLRNIEENWDAAVSAIGEQRARAWRLFAAMSVVGCEMRNMSVTHTVARRP